MDERDYADMQIKAMKEDIDLNKMTHYQRKKYKEKQKEIWEWVKNG